MTTPGANELQRLLAGDAAFTPPVQILAGVPAEVRAARPAGTPHSIAEELWHIVYWQDFFVRWLRGEPIAYPEHSAAGWRRLDAVEDGQWSELVHRYQAGLSEAVRTAAEPDLASQYSTLQEPRGGAGPLTLLEVSMNIAVHGAYHLGRIVQLRQMLSCWPPPGGGDSW